MVSSKLGSSPGATNAAKRKPRQSTASKKAAPVQDTVSTDENTSPARDKEAEIQELITILKAQAYRQGNKTYVRIDRADGKAIPCTLVSKDAQAWAFSQYAHSHKGQLPLVLSYKAACIEIHNALMMSDTGEQQPQEEDAQELIINAVKEYAAFTLSTSSPLAYYACVPYLPDNQELSGTITGLWYIKGKKQAMRLSSAYMEAERIGVPLSTGHGKSFDFTLVCINPLGVARRFENVSRMDIEEGELEAKFLGYATFPKTRFERERLNDALQQLAQRPGVKRQEEADSLGWQTCEQYGLVWQCNNGIETRAGFIPAIDAPFLPPNIFSPGNGYTGTADIPAPVDEIWLHLTGGLNDNNTPRLYGKLGAYMRLLLPTGSIEHEEKARAGKLPFPIETIGEPRHGKSSEDNFILSLYGTGFNYNRETFLQEKNSAIGRIGLQGKVRHCLYTDYDHKASETSRDFEKQHLARHAEISYYSDGSDGGTVGKRDGGNRSRGNPVGGNLITGNHEHAPYSIAHGETADELRIMTFTWTKGDKSDDGVSREIDGRRVEIYTWGVETRKWIMECCAQDKERFTRLVAHCYSQATEQVISDDYEWCCDLHRNQTIDCVAMGKLWVCFLKAYHPGSYLLEWFEETHTIFIQDRLTRCQYINRLDAEHKGEQDIKDFVLDTIQNALGTGQLYILNQQGKILLESDTPGSLTRYGYRLTVRLVDGVPTETYDTGAVHGGYYIKRTQELAFLPETLYQSLCKQAYAKKFTLLPREELFKQLVSEEVIIPALSNGKVTSPKKLAWVNGKPDRYITISHDVIYPPVFLTGDETDEQETQEAQGNPFEQETQAVNETPAPGNSHKVEQDVFSVDEADIPVFVPTHS